ncbi:MAG: S8 family serine peptidase [Gammaproteobacteria bacterium]|nr:S8 family serine peptidase [Gammaproteobacteria bacterium]MBU2059631.1 S8 family serine peptidase [Gammaproteobacteria bacterium]MBU2175717.1 S8 family serine peptidase [Gammaproteobacteria bacterium]MBU2248103.1 S8 family serine peptidase [Gammaproteobacteria bacterium]MBU2345849.1 S8 family serine peptidase [Gammaproteobacteria bacterium]
MKNRNKVLLLGTAGCFALSLTSVAVAAAVDGPEFVTAASVAAIDPSDDSTKRYIVKYKDGTTGSLQNGVQSAPAFSVQRAETFARKYKGKVIKHLSSVKSSVLELSPRQLQAMVSDPEVQYIEVDQKRYLFDVITPMAQSTPYGISMVQANQVSDNNAANTPVCVIDTGYRLNHVDLPSSGVTGFAFSGHGSWSTDGNGHGTHVAGTMVALNNNDGVVGVLPSGQAGVHIVKIFNDSGNWTFASDLIDGIQSCQNAGAKVVNMSLGGGSSSQTEQNAMANFYNDGMLLIAAAGNSGNTSLSYPASYDAVVSVAAVDSSRNLASFSQRNAQVELAGPGVAVNSTWNNGGYNSISGTSMASPHVAGVAALVWSNHPQCTAPQIRSALQATAQDRGTAGRDTSFGFGIVQAKAAVDYLTANGCSGGGGGNPPPTGGETFPNLSATTGNWLRGSYVIPSGVSTLTFNISGGTGDADLYVRYNSQPTTSQYNCRPYLDGNTEQCTITNPQAGTWHIGIRAYSTFNGVTFSYSY